ncbi:unnamed protein product [Prorocentrum cordatum]|uniref:RNase H type-1 domain-containing protein n=1 Tax=Prorocentrum cordatum TaxID=2364126 RepID=A0ABN9UAU4_9DINO|nr:unnamed protein product [Polarella glacialis]
MRDGESAPPDLYEHGDMWEIHTPPNIPQPSSGPWTIPSASTSRLGSARRLSHTDPILEPHTLADRPTTATRPRRQHVDSHPPPAEAQSRSIPTMTTPPPTPREEESLCEYDTGGGQERPEPPTRHRRTSHFGQDGDRDRQFCDLLSRPCTSIPCRPQPPIFDSPEVTQMPHGQTNLPNAESHEAARHVRFSREVHTRDQETDNILYHIDFDEQEPLLQHLRRLQAPRLTFEFTERCHNEVSDYMMRTFPYRQLLRDSRLHLYTDGSKHPRQHGQDGWSVVLVGEDEEGFSFQGAIVGKHRDSTLVEIQNLTDNETTSTSSEITALIWALAYIIHKDINHRISVHSDSLGAIQLARMEAFTNRDAHLVQLLVIMYSHVKEYVDLRHVHAHEMNPWNEVADAAANYARIEDYPHPQPEWANILNASPQRCWEFLLDADNHTKDAYPSFSPGMLKAQRVDTTATTAHLSTPTKSTKTSTEIDVNIATYNIQSGREPGHGARRRKEKIHKLRKTMLNLYMEDLHLIGIQEARAPWGVRSGNDITSTSAYAYHVISGGHDQYNLGCELHILTSKPYGKAGAKDLYFRPDQFTVIEHSPRHLVVRIEAPGFRHTVCVAHAPHSRAKPHEKDTFWEMIECATSNHNINIFLIDANARTGSLCSQAIGDQGFKQKEDDNGERFHKVLQGNSLIAANTFKSGGQDHYTWDSGKDVHRLDYIVVGHELFDSISHTSVMYGIDTEHDHSQKNDHFPVKANLAYTVETAYQHGTPKLDTAKLDSETAKNDFQRRLQQIQHPPWETNLNDHTKSIVDQIKDAAYASFKKQHHAPRKPYITEASYALLRFRRTLIKTIRIVKRNGIGSKKSRRRIRYTAHLIANQSASASPDDVIHLMDIPGYTQLMIKTILFINHTDPDHTTAPYHDGTYGTTTFTTNLFDSYLSFIQDADRVLRIRLDHDRDAHLESFSDNMILSAAGNAPRKEWANVRALLTCGGRTPKRTPTPKIRQDDNGAPLTTPQAIAEHALRYYGNIENGINTDIEGVVKHYNNKTAHTKPIPHINNVQTIHNLTAALAASKKGKRGGPDGNTDDMARAAPRQIARLLHPIMMKMQLMTTEPISAKGGFSTHFSKGQGQLHLQKAYRGILLNNTIGKINSKFLRGLFRDILPDLLMDTQCGAVPHKATDFITHTAYTFLDDCRAQARTGSILFLDLREAFHSVIREFIFQLPTQEDELEDVIDNIEIPICLLPSLRQRLRCPAHLNAHVDDSHLCALVADHHTANWMTAKGTDAYVIPRTSTRPGVPYSDAAFNMHFSLVLQAIADDAEGAEDGESGHHIRPCDNPLFSTAPHQGGKLTNMSFVDDLTDFNSTTSHSDIIDITKTSAERLCRTAFTYGLKPHPDKTKVIISFNGTGSNVARSRLAQQNITSIQLSIMSISVQIADQHRLLGTILTNGSMGPEVQNRMRRTEASARALERQILRRRRLPRKTKIKYVHALSTASLTFNHHVWPTLTQTDHQRISNAYSKPYRTAAGLPKTNSQLHHFTATEVVAYTGIPDFDHHQSAGRLRYLPRLLRHAPQQLLQLLDNQRRRKGSWTYMLFQDFDFLRTYLDDQRWPTTSKLDPDVFAWARTTPKHFTNSVNLAVTNYIRAFKDHAHADKLTKVLRPDGPTGADTTPSRDNGAYNFICYECGIVTKTKQGMAIHIGREHRRPEHPRNWASGTSCRICRQNFHSFAKLVKHLTTVARCRRSWHMWYLQGPALTEEDVANNQSIYATSIADNKRRGRPELYHHIPTHASDVTPLPSLDLSPSPPPFFPTVPELTPPPPAHHPRTPTRNRSLLYLTNTERHPNDLLDITDQRLCYKGMVMERVIMTFDDLYSVDHPSQYDALDSIHQHIRQGDFAGVMISLSSRTWTDQGEGDQHDRKAASSRTTTEPWGRVSLGGEAAERRLVANHHARLAIHTFHVAHVAEVPALLAQSAAPAGTTTIWNTEMMFYAVENLATKRPTMVDVTSSIYAVYYGSSDEHDNPIDNFVASIAGSPS